VSGALVADVLVRISNATFGYDAVPVLTDVDLEVRATDFVGVVGPSGSARRRCSGCCWAPRTRNAVRSYAGQG
jgi:ABC-type dipeptide/oligopeptide/nickel transport system ATPase component